MAETHIPGPDVIAVTLVAGFAKPALMGVNRFVAVDALAAGSRWMTIGIDQVTALTGQLAV